VQLQRVRGVDQDARVEADRPGQDAALWVDGGLLGGEAAPADQLAHHRVVGGELVKGAVAQQVGAAVAHVDELQVAVAGDGGGGHRCAHAPQAGVGGGPLQDGRVRLPDGAGQRAGRLPGLVEPAVVEGRQRLHRSRRGDLAALVAAEPVGDREHAPAAEIAVLVAGPDLSDVGPREAAQAHVASSMCRGEGSHARAGIVVPTPANPSEEDP
jgi:hypothetical protein